MGNIDYELQFKIIKLLHKPLTREELANELGVSTDTLSKQLKVNKFVFSDVEFPIFIRKNRKSNPVRRDRKGKQKVEIVSDSDTSNEINDNDAFYKTTVNPIILPLNMTEVFALTNLIVEQMKDSDYYDLYKGIADKIYPQLSEYAKTRIGGNINGFNENKPVKFTKEEGLFKDKIPKKILYALKSGNKVRIKMIDGCVLIGSISMNDKKITILDNSGKKHDYSKLKPKIISIEEY